MANRSFLDGGRGLQTEVSYSNMLPSTLASRHMRCFPTKPSPAHFKKLRDQDIALLQGRATDLQIHASWGGYHVAP